MSKRPSLFGAKSAPVAPEPAADASKPDEPARVEAVPSAEPAGPKRYPKATTREGKRVVTAYVSPEAFRQLKRIAADEDAQVQDLLAEGLNAIFEKRGLSRIA
ncbi:ribbon-helix-helix domain-containing protein [Methylorubrum suomiense]|uniref:Antitoxin-like ribbon-helix-helix domain-containing protein n=1 Tax=Methylorubrum suomiense TaxID=144191 RepID=A0ABQ4V1W1_9HYPH|nr:ribbon-helix-helix domain-containing protein [Methylorubrum suomiense]GJE78585.1 hypothetical protein BGCPKDLD_5202 [Methylorubrum suomiense]